jgi:hypothetical protein
MITVKDKSKDVPSEVYIKFGLEQTDLINVKFDSWLAQQTFARKCIDSHYSNLVFDPQSEYCTFEGEKYPDKLEWQLSFAEEIKTNEDDLSAALLHEKRLPSIITFNSAPNIFDTANYVHVSVSNGERGWVKEGKFPVNVHIIENDENGTGHLEKRPVHTDIQRDALTGFNAAYEWQKFRAMASASPDVLQNEISNKWNELHGKINTGKINGHEVHDRMRSCMKTAYPILVGLLPDTRLENGPSSLKQFYFPGALEGTLAFELEDFVYQTFGFNPELKPIYNVKGNPIEITGNSKKYEALMKLGLNVFGFNVNDWEKLKPIIERKLSKDYNVEFKSPNEMEVIFQVENAQKIAEAIREGDLDTSFHKSIRNFGNALTNTTSLIKSWGEIAMPNLERRYERLIDLARVKFFQGLEKRIID